MQTFERRARLGLEKPAWNPSPGFALLWDRSFATFRTWQACKRKETYRENWIEWGELEKARRTEGFRFLESELRRATLTVPVPGGFTYWTGARPPAHGGLQVLQAREPATIKLLPPKQPPAQDEALNLLGTPERSARRSWLASIPGIATPPPPREGSTAAGLSAASAPGASPGAQGKLPFWIEAAIRLGVHFLRVAAAGVPPASNDFVPRHEGDAAAADDCSPSPAVAGCCAVCGRRHEAVIDEYYFWLVDSRYFSPDDPQRDPNANWDDDPGAGNADLPKLLSWTSRPSVVLMWSRMHDGELMQPRRSTHSLPVEAGAQALGSRAHGAQGRLALPPGHRRQAGAGRLRVHARPGLPLRPGDRLGDHGAPGRAGSAAHHLDRRAPLLPVLRLLRAGRAARAALDVQRVGRGGLHAPEPLPLRGGAPVVRSVLRPARHRYALVLGSPPRSDAARSVLTAETAPRGHQGSAPTDSPKRRRVLPLQLRDRRRGATESRHARLRGDAPRLGRRDHAPRRAGGIPAGEGRLRHRGEDPGQAPAHRPRRGRSPHAPADGGHPERRPRRRAAEPAAPRTLRPHRRPPSRHPREPRRAPAAQRSRCTRPCRTGATTAAGVTPRITSAAARAAPATTRRARTRTNGAASRAPTASRSSCRRRSSSPARCAASVRAC